MKNFTKVIIFLALVINFAACEKEEVVLTEKVTLQPNTSEGVDATISSINQTINFGNESDASLLAINSGTGLNVTRFLINFDLSSIPENAIITNASLSLYFNDDSKVTSKHFGDNYFIIKRITSEWDEQTINWENQPFLSNTNQITVPKSDIENQDFTNINVTNLVKDMVFYKTKSFGFHIRLQLETASKALILASSDHANAAKHPKLEIEYIIK